MTKARSVAGRHRIAWLAGHVRSGNTWRRALLANFLAARDEPLPLDDIEAALPGRRTSDRTAFDALAGIASSDCTEDEADMVRPAVYRAQAARAEAAGIRLYCQAHDAYRDTPSGEALFPDDATCGAIYAVRNPLDVAVSWAFYRGRERCEGATRPLCDPDHHLRGTGWPRLREVTFDWSRHVESWLAAPFPVLLVRYEDLLADPAVQLGRIVQFLGLEGADDQTRLQRAANFASFRNLQADEEEAGYRYYAVPGRRFFRSGRAGDWRNHLTPDQAQEIVDAHRRVMARLGYDVPDCSP